MTYLAIKQPAINHENIVLKNKKINTLDKRLDKFISRADKLRNRLDELEATILSLLREKRTLEEN